MHSTKRVFGAIYWFLFYFMDKIPDVDGMGCAMGAVTPVPEVTPTPPDATATLLPGSHRHVYFKECTS